MDPYSRDDVPEELYRKLTEYEEKHKQFQALNDKVEQHEKLIQQLLGYMQVFFYFLNLKRIHRLNNSCLLFRYKIRCRPSKWVLVDLQGLRIQRYILFYYKFCYCTILYIFCMTLFFFCFITE